MLALQPLNTWPMAERRRIIGVFTDIDDTLTTHGQITPDALQALGDLKAAGLYVIPITGRNLGWCEPLLTGGAAQQPTPWPVDALVAENGALALVPSKNLSQIGLQPAWNLRKPLSKLYQQDAATRAAHHARMAHVAAQVLAAVPGLQRARDVGGRETDLAFDYAEFTQLPPAAVQQTVALLQAQGMHTTVSSIHIHGCFDAFDKWSGAQWIVRHLYQRELSAELERWVFVGDSGNDQAMFEHFTHSVGVANIARFAPQMQHLPRYVARGERGSGFAQVVGAVLEAIAP
jgi:HAD superfamily hydrolase (TIGR01484 family)